MRGAAVQTALRTAVRLVYPPRCLSCGEMVESDFALCGACWGETAFVAGLVCDLCGTPLPGEGDGVSVHCDDCMAIARPWSGGRAALVYSGTGRSLVLALKHGDRTDIARPAARWLARAAAPVTAPGALLVPVPLHPFRLIRRRYNQSALLARALARETGCDWLPDALVRIRRTPGLDGRSRAERFTILADAIRPHPRAGRRLAGRDVLLVDDVMTSGATLAASAEAALASGAASVCVAVLARVAKDT